MKKPEHIKICLNGMVGSEEATIERMLHSVVGYVDYYVIQCNGKDNTKQIIDDFFAKHGVPGFTYHIDWNFPGWNRDHTLQECLKADHGCDWILRMDADEQLAVDADFDWSIFEDTSIDSFNIMADPGDSKYFRTWLWNAKREWYFTHDKRHETIHLPIVDEAFTRVALPQGFRHIITNDGETWLAPMKFLSDALELERDKVPSNLVLEDDYHLWYIGKSYSDSYGNPDEFPFGMEHAKEYARRSIFYFRMYLDRLHNYSNTGKARTEDDMGYFAMYLMANANHFMGNTDVAIQLLKEASQFNPRRNENYYRMAELLVETGRYQEMLEATEMLVKAERTNPFPTYSFMIHNLAYHDSGFQPYWMHLKALRLNNESMEKQIVYINKLKNLYPNDAAWVISNLGLNTEVEEQPIQNNINVLSGVFGITR